TLTAQPAGVPQWTRSRDAGTQTCPVNSRSASGPRAPAGVLGVDVAVDEPPAEVVHLGRSGSVPDEDALHYGRHVMRDVTVRAPAHDGVPRGQVIGGQRRQLTHRG